MDYSHYGQNEAIATFFDVLVPQHYTKDRSVTQAECDQYAKTLLGTADIVPVRFQGTASYTTYSPHLKHVVQFRLRPLDEQKMSLAPKAYGDLVPQVTSMNTFTLPVYNSKLNEGHLHIFQSFPEDPEDRFPIERQLRTVRDVAAFIARGASLPLARETLTPNGWTMGAKNRLEQIRDNITLQSIEPRFSQRANALLTQIPKLDQLPAVITVPDLAELNLMIDPESGALTGVLDFDDASIGAWGMCISGVYEIFFGQMREVKWKWFEDKAPESEVSVREVLEEAFWEAFWEAAPEQYSRQEYEEAVRLATEIGMVNRYVSDDLLDRFEEHNEQHRRDLEWARGIWLGSKVLSIRD
ncbi:hypothetical protein BDZ85DRAFT_322098 [Elsinoe ampelina]|uniref:Aminoglycoside phosphotransferase domain-containing protein n=1 Tax=Elsinoe ampelina TaxID=302913 RepID=A0A6A6G1U2_9PEZI|nr:hypothetical protein BDZ85DRAFT_322098 [Elsinoe ampelina]